MSNYAPTLLTLTQTLLILGSYSELQPHIGAIHMPRSLI